MMLPKLRFASSNPKKLPSLCQSKGGQRANEPLNARGETKQRAPPKECKEAFALQRKPFEPKELGNFLPLLCGNSSRKSKKHAVN